MRLLSSIFRRAVPQIAAALTLLGATTPQLAAQADPDSVKLRNDCRLARQVLESGQPSPHRTDALSLIPLCGQDAVPALLTVWSEPPTERAELSVLVNSTRSLVIPQLVDALLSTLERTNLETNQRAAALLVLVTYADSSLAPGFEDIIGPRDDILSRHYGHVVPPYTAVGHDTLLAPLRDRLKPVLMQLAAADPDPMIQTAAEVVLRSLR